MHQASKPGGPSQEKKTQRFFCGKLLRGGFGQARQGCAAGRCLCWAVLFCVFYGKYDQTNKTQGSWQPPSSSALLPTALATSDLALRDRLASLNTGNRNPLTLVDAKLRLCLELSRHVEPLVPFLPMQLELVRAHDKLRWLCRAPWPQATAPIAVQSSFLAANS